MLTLSIVKRGSFVNYYLKGGGGILENPKFRIFMALLRKLVYLYKSHAGDP